MLVRFDYPKTYNTLIDDLLSTDCIPGRSAFPAMDLIEKENETLIVAELPGVKKEDVKITFENNVLTISGSRKPNEIPEKANLLINELQSGDFNRSIKFGQDVETTKMSAEMSNGILTITLPKTESVKAKEIHIN
jgi:HSP20 family protein